MKLILNKTILSFLMILLFQFVFSQQKTKTLYEKKVNSIAINFLNELGLNTLANKYNNTGNLGQLMALSEISSRLKTKKGTIAFLRFNEELKNAEKLKNAQELKNDKIKKEIEEGKRIVIEKEKEKNKLIDKHEKSDYVIITKNIKSEFSKWLQKDEFEKITAYNNRIKNNTQFSFDSICSSTIIEAINRRKENAEAQLFTDEYDSENEVFKINIKVFDKTIKDTLKVKINNAKELKKSSEYGKYLIFPEDLNEWCIIDNDLYPSKLFINDYDFKREIKLKFSEINQLNFSTSDLGISDNNIDNVKFNYEDYKKALVLKEIDRKRKDSIQDSDIVYNSAGVDNQPKPLEGFTKFHQNINEKIKSAPILFTETKRVFIKLIVDKDGSLTDIQIIRGINAEIDEQIIKIVSESPKWKSGDMNGKQVRTSFSFPLIINNKI